MGGMTNFWTDRSFAVTNTNIPCFNKKQPFCFLLYLLGKWTCLHKKFSKRSWVNVYFACIKITELVNKYSLVPMWVFWRHADLFCNDGTCRWSQIFDQKLRESRGYGATCLCRMFLEKNETLIGVKTLIKETDYTSTIRWLPGDWHLQQTNMHFSCRLCLIIRSSEVKDML